MKLLSGVQTPVGFFDTEAEARRWIDEQRAAHECAISRT